MRDKKRYGFFCVAAFCGIFIVTACSRVDEETGKRQEMQSSANQSEVNRENTEEIQSSSEWQSGADTYEGRYLEVEDFKLLLAGVRSFGKSIERVQLYDQCFVGGFNAYTTQSEQELLAEQILGSTNTQELLDYLGSIGIILKTEILQPVEGLFPFDNGEATFVKESQTAYVFWNNSSDSLFLIEARDNEGKYLKFSPTETYHLMDEIILNEFYKNRDSCQFEYYEENRSSQMLIWEEEKSRDELLEGLFKWKFIFGIKEDIEELNIFAMLKMDDTHYIEFYDIYDSDDLRYVYAIAHVVYDENDFVIWCLGNSD